MTKGLLSRIRLHITTYTPDPLGAKVRRIRCDQVLVGRGRTDAFRLIVRPAQPNQRHWAARKTEPQDTLYKSTAHKAS